MLTFIRSFKKYHLSMFGANILGIVLALFFVISYKAKHLSLVQPLILIKIVLLAFFLCLFLVIKPRLKIKRIMPSIPFILLNLAMAFFISSFFMQNIGGDGLLFVLLFSFFLAETEYVLYEYAKRK